MAKCDDAPAAIELPPPRAEPVAFAWATPGQTAAVLTLLPELIDCAPLPPAFLVAHRAGAPSELLGAAAFVPAMRHAPSPGFRGLVRVLPGWRRQGIGRALVARLAAEVWAWDVPHLLAWQPEPAGEASRVMQALGFRIDYTLHHFLIDKAIVLPACQERVRRLQARGRIPPGYGLHALAQVPRQAVVALHAQEFNADHEAAAVMLARELADPLVGALSFGLWNGHTLAAYLLAGRGADELPEVRFWASDRRLRGGWAAALVLEAFVRHASDRGGQVARYHCNANALAPLNVARKSGAQEIAVTQGWVLDLAAPASLQSAPITAAAQPIGAP